MHLRRVHIVPFDDAPDRAVKSAVSNHADMVYLLPDERTCPRDIQKRSAQRLSEHGIDTELHTVDHLDMYAVFGLVTTLASRSEHDDDNVFVNVSTGSRVAAIGAALGCMDVSTDATPYHVDGELTTDVEPVRLPTESHGSKGQPLVTYPVDSLTRSQLVVLAVVAVETSELSAPTKRRLIDRAIGLELRLETPIALGTRLVETASHLDRSHERGGFDNLTADEKKSAYRTLETMVLGRLLEDDHLREVSSGRSDQLELTDRGENALRAFRHKITDVIRNFDEGDVPEWLREGIAETR